VKGINFKDMISAGDPVELAKRYVNEGADELVFLDITATTEKRKTLVALVSRIASVINIPFTVGGGIDSLDDAKAIIDAGADKLSINSAAIRRPKLIAEIANLFGSQCAVLAIDTKLVEDKWLVFANGGKVPVQMQALQWAQTSVNLGAGEILLTSIGNDGTKDGFALDITREIAACVMVPVIASGGAGKPEHFSDVFSSTVATGALAASIFHFGDVSISELKEYLDKQNIPIRL
jgi:cyclase